MNLRSQAFFLLVSFLAVRPLEARELPDAPADLSNYAIKYVEGPPAMGKYITTKDLVIGPTQANITLDRLDTFGKCRMACWTYVHCKSASFGIENGQSICRLTSLGPLNTNLKSLKGATYFFFTDDRSAVDNHYYGMQSNGLLYVVLNRWEKFDDALEQCKKIPGHHLAGCNSVGIEEIFQDIWTKGRIDQINYENMYLKKMWLNCAGDVNACWQRAYYSDGIDDTKKDWSGCPLCQAIPLGLTQHHHGDL